MKDQTIDHFKGAYAFLSNFYPTMIYEKGLRFRTVEHAYVASKTLDRDFQEKISNLDAKFAGHAKSLGRECKLKNGWDEIKVSTMMRLLRKKFEQRTLKQKLLDTKEALLVEGNYWHDNFWGDCFCQKCQKVEGQNILGKLLMQLREEYKYEDLDNG
jgi:ribA/ribD-fused uncharacterized protein